MPTVQIVGGKFQDGLGNPVAGGTLAMSLSQDGKTSDNCEVSAGRELIIVLDSEGSVSVSPAVRVWPNDQLTPTDTNYTASVYTDLGELVWGPNTVGVLSSPVPFDIGSWVPPDYGGGSTSTGGGGSGMLPPKTVTIHVTSAGTHFVLPDTPFGGVLVALYLGAGYLDLSQYTLTGRSIDLMFTAQDGDTLYAVYF